MFNCRIAAYFFFVVRIVGFFIVSIETFFVFIGVRTKVAFVVAVFSMYYVVTLKELFCCESEFAKFACKRSFFANLHIIMQ